MLQEDGNFTEFENPVYRELFRRAANEEELERVRLEFMKGNWSVFGAVAPGLIAGNGLPRPEGDATPHAAFWSGFMSKATEDERREFIGFLLRAQLANGHVKSRPARVPAGGFTTACRQSLMEYLSMFKDPAHAPDPRSLLGLRLIHYDHLPDERMVQLTGMYAVEEAIPVLEVFLGMRRRFHQLMVDYSTCPKEVDTVFLETVRALVRIAISDDGQRERVLGVLRRAIEGAGGEKVWFEVHSHNNYSGDVSQHVDERDISELGMVKKGDLLEAAVRAVEGDEGERRTFEGRDLQRVPYSWVIPGPDGGGMIFDDRLYLLGNFRLEAVELGTGRSIFMIDIGMSGSGSGVGCYYPVLSTTEYGAPVLVTLIDDTTADLKEWHAITFDLDTGEVTSMSKLCFQPSRAWGPTVWVRPDEGIVLHMGEERLLWKQEKDGHVVWKKDLEEQSIIRCCLHRIAILTKTDLTMLHSENGKTRVRRHFKGLLEDAETTGTYRDDMVISEEGFFTITREGGVLYFDHHGQFMWKKGSEECGRYLTQLAPLQGGLVGENNDEFYRITIDGKVSSFKKPDWNIKDRLVNRHGAFFMAESHGKIAYRAFDSNETREVLTDLPVVKSLVALNDDFLVIRFFEDQHLWACLPRSSW